MLPSRPVTRHAHEEQLPFISIIVTAHNEESSIKDKLSNTLSVNYPLDCYEIIVSSDASTDATDQIVQNMESSNIKLVKVYERKGKEYAQLQAINEARGEIVVFTDVSTRIADNALNCIADVFCDPRIGAVSSEDKFVSENGDLVGEGLYVKYEMWLRRQESRVNSLVGLSGSFFAARRLICDDWNIKVPSDFNTAFNCIRKGYISVSCPALLGLYKNIRNYKGEYARKYRTAVRGFSAISSNLDILNPFKTGFFAFQIWSHKILRWSVPWFLVALLVSTLYLYNESIIYIIILFVQLVFYCAVIVGAYSDRMREKFIFRVPFYFMQVNIAIAHAFVAYIFGKRITVWDPSVR